MKVVLVSMFDAYNFAVRILQRVLSDNGYNAVTMFYKKNYGEQKSTDREIQDFATRVNALSPDVVGFTVRSAFYPEFKRIAPFINSRIVVGGQHPTVCPEDFEGYTVCVGEGEDVICDIVEGKDGLVYGGMTDNVNIIPQMVSSGMKKMSVMTARGCFFNCSFCYNSLQRKIIKGWKVRRRDVGNVMKEVKGLMATCPNLEEIVFSDNIFTFNHEWVKEFCREFKKTGLRFRCFGHFSMFEPRTLEVMKDSGCHIVTAGIQSCERIRKKYFNKHESDEQIIEGSNMLAFSGILGRYDRVTNIPYETSRDSKDMAELLSNLALPFVLREFPLINNPKTEFTQMLLKDRHITENDVQGIATNAYKPWGKFTYYAVN